MGISRRRFLSQAGTISAGAMSGLSLESCSLFSEKEIKACTKAELAQDGSLQLTFNGEEILLRSDEGKVTCFYLECRHKRCTVEWLPKRRQFLCPCHDGRYDQDGNVIDGPPKKPLHRLKTELRGNDWFVLNEWDEG